MRSVRIVMRCYQKGTSVLTGSIVVGFEQGFGCTNPLVDMSLFGV